MYQCQEYAQSIVDCLRKKPTFTAPITNLVKIRAEITVMNVAKIYDSSTDVGKENKKAPPLSPLTERSPALSASFKHDEKKNSQKKRDASHSSGSFGLEFGSSSCSLENYKIDRHNKAGKSVSLLLSVQTNIVTALNCSTYHLNMQLR